MKRLFKISGSLFLLSSLFLTSCLKDDSLTLNTDLSNNVTEFGNTGSVATAPSGGAAPRFNIDLGSLNTGDTASFNINVDFAGDEMAPQDVTVQIDIDESLLTTYNEAHSVDGANYIASPSGFVTTGFPITLTIPKGQQWAQAKVAIKLTADFDFNASYALPLRITSTSVGEVSGNFGTALYALNVRNVFDGVYDIKGYILREGDNVLSGNYTGEEVEMSTVGPYSLEYDHHVWADGSTTGGIDGLTLTIDPATNKVKVSCRTNSAVVNQPAYDSRYEPDSRTFYVSYYWGAGPTNRAATDTLTWNRAR